MTAPVNNLVRREKKSSSDNWAPSISLLEGVQASAELSTSITEDLFEYKKQQDITTGVMLPPEEVQQKYPFIEKKFNDPIPEDRAKYMDEVAKRRYRLNMLKEQGINNSAGVFAIDFVNGLVDSVTDPIELAVNIGTGFGIAALGKQLARTTSTTMGARLAFRLASKLAKNKTVMEVAENFAGSVVLEPGYFALQNKLQRDYGIEDAALNVVVGSTAYTGAKLAAKNVWKYGKGTYLKISNKILGKELDDNLSRAMNGLPLDDSKTKQALDEFNSVPKRNIDFDDDTINYAHQDFTPNTPMYAAYSTNKDISVPFAHYFGDDLLYLTSDPNRANTLTSEKYSDDAMVVMKVDVSKMNILNADEGFELSVGKLQEAGFFDRIEADGLVDRFGKDLNEAKSFDDFLTKVREGIDSGKYTDDDLHDTLGALSDSGYDGINMEVDGSGNKHHGLFVFPGKEVKAEIKASYSPKKNAYPDLSDKYSKTLDSDTKKATIADIEKEIATVLTEDKIDSMADEAIKNNLESLSMLEKQELLSSESKKVLDSVKENLKEVDTISKRMNDFINCLERNF